MTTLPQPVEKPRSTARHFKCECGGWKSMQTNGTACRRCRVCMTRTQNVMRSVRHDLYILWTAMGFTRKQIAPMLRLSVKRVEMIGLEIRDFLGLDDAPAITRYAIREGFIEA